MRQRYDVVERADEEDVESTRRLDPFVLGAMLASNAVRPTIPPPSAEEPPCEASAREPSREASARPSREPIAREPSRDTSAERPSREPIAREPSRDRRSGGASRGSWSSISARASGMLEPVAVDPRLSRALGLVAGAFALASALVGSVAVLWIFDVR